MRKICLMLILILLLFSIVSCSNNEGDFTAPVTDVFIDRETTQDFPASDDITTYDTEQNTEQEVVNETVQQKDTIQAHSHTYSKTVVEPTCEEDGYTTYTCSCGYAYNANEVSATGHTYSKTVVEPTCTERGHTTFTCLCGDSYTENITASLGHSYSKKVTAPTCTESGYTTFICFCGDTYTANTVSATGHSYSKKVTAPTCTEDGYTTYTCFCGDTYTANKVIAYGHSWGNWKTTIPADVGVVGQESRVCSVCTATETREIPALQVDYKKEWFITQFGIAKQQYIHDINKSITEKENQIEDLTESASALYVSYMQEVKRIKERYPNSATRDIMLENAQQNYSRSAKIYTEKIDVLENEISNLEKEVANPNVDNVLSIVAKNCNISSMEIYEYYYKYCDSLG